MNKEITLTQVDGSNSKEEELRISTLGQPESIKKSEIKKTTQTSEKTVEVDQM